MNWGEVITEEISEGIEIIADFVRISWENLGVITAGISERFSGSYSWRIIKTVKKMKRGLNNFSKEFMKETLKDLRRNF